MIRVLSTAVILLLAPATGAMAYEVFGNVVATTLIGSVNDSFSASFTAGLPIVGGAGNANYSVVPFFWSPGSAVVDVPENAAPLPLAGQLYQNHPNPFSGRTAVAFDVGGQRDAREFASLEIFDIRGRLVRTLAYGAWAPGHHRIEWDGVGSNGEHVPNGVYLMRYRSDVASQTIRMVLVR